MDASIVTVLIGPQELVATLTRNPVLEISQVQFAAVVVFTNKLLTALTTNREEVAECYKEDSILTFNGEKFQGASIVTKLSSLPLHTYSDVVIDYQPSPDPGGVIALVSGKVQLLLPPQQPVEEQLLPPQTVSFSQMFHLKPTSLGTYYVTNHMFRENP